MKITIDERVLKKYKIPFEQFLLLMFIKKTQGTVYNYNNVLESLNKRGFMYSDELLMKDTSDMVESILCESEISSDLKSIEDLAVKLQEMWPKGKKDNKWYWRGNKKEIILKLEKFFKIYGEYSFDQVLDAARKYVDSFNLRGNSYMKLLKYFIIKEIDGMQSDLATEIERMNEEDETLSSEELF